MRYATSTLASRPHRTRTGLYADARRRSTTAGSRSRNRRDDERRFELPPHARAQRDSGDKTNSAGAWDMELGDGDRRCPGDAELVGCWPLEAGSEKKQEGEGWVERAEVEQEEDELVDGELGVEEG